MGKNQAVEKAEYFAESIGRMAYQALLEEVYTVPKPGISADLYAGRSFP